MRDRLIELFKQADLKAGEYIRENDHMDFIPTQDEIAGVYADHLLANGLIVPPIAVCGIAYVVPTAQNQLKEITEMRCIGYIIGESGMNYNLLDWKNKLFQPSFDSFGKTVFLAREEAEQALARVKGESDER